MVLPNKIWLEISYLTTGEWTGNNRITERELKRARERESKRDNEK